MFLESFRRFLSKVLQNAVIHGGDIRHTMPRFSRSRVVMPRFSLRHDNLFWANGYFFLVVSAGVAAEGAAEGAELLSDCVSCDGAGECRKGRSIWLSCQNLTAK